MDNSQSSSPQAPQPAAAQVPDGQANGSAAPQQPSAAPANTGYSAQTVPPVQSIKPLDGPIIVHHEAETTKAPVQKKSFVSKTKLLIACIVIALFAAIYLGVYYYVNSQVDKATTPTITGPTVFPNKVVTPTSSVAVSPSIDPTATWTQVKLVNLTLKIPQGWSNSPDPNDLNTMYINPTQPVRGAIPAYTLTIAKNTNIANAQNTWLNAWKLVNPQQSSLTILGIPVAMIEGQTKEAKPRTVTVAFFANNTNVYYLLDEGVAEDHANTFDKILSTISFAPSVATPTAGPASAAQGLAPVVTTTAPTPNTTPGLTPSH